MMTSNALLIPGFHVGVAFFIAIAVAVALLERGGALRDPRSFRWLLIGLGPFLVLSLLLPWGPVHDHLSFISRAECAYVPSCTGMLPWSRPALDVFGALLHAIPGPFGPDTILAASWLLELGALVVLFGAVRELRARDGGSLDPERTAALTLAIVASNLAWVRVATGGTMWGLTVFWLACSFLLGMVGARSRERLPILAAVLSLALAAASNAAVQPLLVTFPVAWITWRARSPRRRLELADFVVGAVGIGAAGLVVVPFALDVWAFVSSNGGVGREPLDAVRNTPLLQWRHTPLLTVVAGCVGAARAIGRERAYLPVLVALLSTEWILAAQVVPWTIGYPTFYIHTHLTGFLFAILAGSGIAFMIQALRPWNRPGWAAGAVGALLVLGALTATYGREFATERRILDREVEMIGTALRDLPEHDCLVLPPAIPPFESGPVAGCDPVEVNFPTEAYVEARRRAGSAHFCLLTYEDAVRMSKPRESRWLVYAGSVVLSWTSCEIVAGHVPPNDVRRSPLGEIDSKWQRVPAFTWPQTTSQNPAVTQRLLADRQPEVELGFYYLEPRDHGRSDDGENALQATADTRPPEPAPPSASAVGAASTHPGSLFESLERWRDAAGDLPGGCRIVFEAIEPPIVRYELNCPSGRASIAVAASPGALPRADYVVGTTEILVEPPEMSSHPTVLRLAAVLNDRVAGRTWAETDAYRTSDDPLPIEWFEDRENPGARFVEIGVIGFGFGLFLLRLGLLGRRWRQSPGAPRDGEP